jgi:hypothetical protein
LTKKKVSVKINRLQKEMSFVGPHSELQLLLLANGLAAPTAASLFMGHWAFLEDPFGRLLPAAIQNVSQNHTP